MKYVPWEALRARISARVNAWLGHSTDPNAKGQTRKLFEGRCSIAAQGRFSPRAFFIPGSEILTKKQELALYLTEC